MTNSVVIQLDVLKALVEMAQPRTLGEQAYRIVGTTAVILAEREAAQGITVINLVEDEQPCVDHQAKANIQLGPHSCGCELCTDILWDAPVNHSSNHSSHVHQ